MPHNNPRKKHKDKLYKKAAHKKYKKKVMVESNKILQADSSNVTDKFTTIASQATAFAYDTVITSAQYYIGKMAKLATKNLANTVSALPSTLILASKLKSQEKYETFSSAIADGLDEPNKKIVQAIVAGGALALSTCLLPQYDPWHYIPCLAISVLAKKGLNELCGKEEKVKDASFTSTLIRASFKGMLISQTLGSLGVTSTQVAPLFFLTKPILSRGFDQLINHRLIPVTHQIYKEAKQLGVQAIREEAIKLSQAKRILDKPAQLYLKKHSKFLG